MNDGHFRGGQGGPTGGTRLVLENLFDDDDRFGDAGTMEIDGVAVCACGTACRSGCKGGWVGQRVAWVRCRPGENACRQDGARKNDTYRFDSTMIRASLSASPRASS